MRAFAWMAVSLCACADPLPIGGEHHSYVVSRQQVPVNNTLARELGLDLNGDGTVDNQFGMVLATFASDNLLQSQVRTDGAIDRGDLLQLIDLQRPENDERFATGFALQIGADAQPTPCVDAMDVVCRRHLDGSGVFSVAAGNDSQLHCESTDTGFECGPGRLTFLLGIMGTPLQVDALGFPPLAIELFGARVTFEDVGDGRLHGRIAGGVSHEDMDRVIGDYMKIIDRDVQHDCMLDAPMCTCVQSSAGKFYLGFLDANHDCTVSLDEIRTNSVLVSLLTPDVKIDGKPTLSLGVGFEAVPATLR